MLSDTDAVCVAVALVLCLINGKNCLWVQERYQHRRHANLMADFNVSQTTTDFIFVRLDGPSLDGILRIAVTRTVAKEILLHTALNLEPIRDFIFRLRNFSSTVVPTLTLLSEK